MSFLFLVETLRAPGLPARRAVLAVGAHSGGDCLQRCPLVARKAPAVPVLRVHTHVTTIARAVSAGEAVHLFVWLVLASIGWRRF
jgi:hypothetical protein